jgi:hypothetical protein
MSITSMRRRTTWALAGVLLVAALAWSASRGAATAGAAERVADQDVRPFWWTHTGSQSSASVWFGPPVELGLGELFRTWTLVCTNPGSEEPLACLQGYVRVAGDEPIAYRGPLSRIELRPLAGWTWAQVVSEESIEAELEGFY